MSEMEEEFNKLLQSITAAQQNKSNIDDTVKIVMDFFMHLKMKMESASPEERTQMVKQMSDMYQKLTDTLKNVGERTGMTEQELLAFAENPNNFTPEQWRTMQESKRALIEFNRAVSRAKERQNQEPKKVSKPSDKEHKKGSRASRSKWMRM